MIPPSFHSGIPALCIDASSIIYHLKTGLLGSLAAEVRLVSTPQVVAETGWPHLPVEALSVAQSENMTNDESLLVLAGRENLPVLSEDREILESAREEGREYYNTLMMLNYLLLKGRVLPEEYGEYLRRLKDCSHYNQEVLSFGRSVYESILAALK